MWTSRPDRGWASGWVGSSAGWVLRASGCGGALSASVGVAFDDEFVAGADESVDGGLGEEGVGHQGQPLVGFPVGGDHGGCVAVRRDDQAVEVGGLGCVARLQAEIVDDQEWGFGEA